MRARFAGRYVLRAPGPSEGRPCWVQAVRGSPDLFVCAQAMHPHEPGHPHVETLLVQLGDDGAIRAYGSDAVLGWLGTQARGRRVITWVDGSNVRWEGVSARSRAHVP